MQSASAISTKKIVEIMCNNIFLSSQFPAVKWNLSTIIRGSVLKFLESGNENAATFSADDFCQNSNIYVIVYIYRTSKAVKFYLLRSSKNHKY